MDFRKISNASPLAYIPLIAAILVLVTIVISNPARHPALYGATIFIAGTFFTIGTKHLRDTLKRRVAPAKSVLSRDQDGALLEIAGRTAKLGGWMVHLSTGTIEWSGQTWAIHELQPRSSISVKEAFDFYAPEGRQRIVSLFEKCARDGTPYDVELEIITPSGRRKWIRAMGAAMRNEACDIVRVHGAFQDIDEPKRLELAARDRDQKFAETMESISDAFFNLDREWRFAYLNREAERLLGKSGRAMIGSLIWDEFPEAAAGIIRQEYERAAALQKTADFEVYYASLDTWFSVTAYPSVTGLTVYFRDVTERRLVEQRLKLLEMAVSKIKDFVIVTEAASPQSNRQTIFYVNDAFVEVTGYSREEAIGRSPSFLQGAKTQAPLVKMINAALSRAKPVRAELINYTKDGREYWSDMSIAPIFDHQGQPTHFVATGRDISDRKKAQEVLAESEERFGIVAMMTTDAVWDWHIEHNLVRWNDNISSVFGHQTVPPEEGLHQWETNIHPDDREAVVTSVRTAIGADDEYWQMEYRFQRGDGRYASVFDQGHIIRNTMGLATRMVGGIRDITASRAIEAKKLQAQRLEAIGQLTGGVAHDFNNLLTVIMGTAETLADELATDERLAQIAELNWKASERGAALTRQLLMFAGRQPLEPEVLNINNLILDIEDLLLSALGEAIDLRMIREENLWSVKVDAAQLESSILNLCLNARDAMSQGGVLTLSTANVEAIRGDTPTQGSCVVIRISDNGRGMNASIKAQAFEPFFTTKAFGKGSGLGLSMVYGFVRQSGGHVDIESEPGKGTTVSLYLPRIEELAHPSNLRSAVAIPGGSERILIVEDDDMVRGFAQQLLTSLGYDIACAANADEAIVILETAQPFDLMFTDIVMPGAMNGRQLAERVRDSHPRMPVLLTTGFAAVIDNEGASDGNLVGKPYSRRQIAEKIRENLNNRGAERVTCL